MKTTAMLERQRAAWQRIAKAAAALARSKGHDVADPEYTVGGGIDHEMMVNLETLAIVLGKLAGVDDRVAEEAIPEDLVAEEADNEETGDESAPDEARPKARRRRK